MKSILGVLCVVVVLGLTLTPASAGPFGLISIESNMQFNPLSGPSNQAAGPAPSAYSQPQPKPSVKRPKKDKREARGHIAPDGKR